MATQRAFVGVLLEFVSFLPEHWADAFVCLEHHTQDDIRNTVASLMAMQHDGMIRELMYKTLRGGNGNPHDMVNCLNMSDGTMDEVVEMAKRTVHEHHVAANATNGAQVTEGVEVADSIGVTDGVSQKLKSKLRECFALGAQMTFCEVDSERVNSYLSMCSDLASETGQQWVIGRLEEELKM